VITLETIQQADFERFLEREVRGYAAEHVRNGNWPAEGSLERSRKEFESLLPNGILSQNQYLWSICNGTEKIGVLWVEVKNGKAFIYDFVIEESFRSRGFGKQALTAMEEKLKAMEVESVGLHVFGDNVGAQELYKKMGFRITGIQMKKSLREPIEGT
jgi:ribosomal protein S18 acetylase RimI-like enzyme